MEEDPNSLSNSIKIRLTKGRNLLQSAFRDLEEVKNGCDPEAFIQYCISEIGISPQKLYDMGSVFRKEDKENKRKFMAETVKIEKEKARLKRETDKKQRQLKREEQIKERALKAEEKARLAMEKAFETAKKKELEWQKRREVISN